MRKGKIKVSCFERGSGPACLRGTLLKIFLFSITRILLKTNEIFLRCILLSFIIRPVGFKGSKAACGRLGGEYKQPTQSPNNATKRICSNTEAGKSVSLDSLTESVAFQFAEHNLYNPFRFLCTNDLYRGVKYTLLLVTERQLILQTMPRNRSSISNVNTIRSLV